MHIAPGRCEGMGKALEDHCEESIRRSKQDQCKEHLLNEELHDNRTLWSHRSEMNLFHINFGSYECDVCRFERLGNLRQPHQMGITSRS